VYSALRAVSVQLAPCSFLNSAEGNRSPAFPRRLKSVLVVRVLLLVIEAVQSSCLDCHY